MPVDICQPAAGKRSAACTTGGSSFDIFRSKPDPPRIATGVHKDSLVTENNPIFPAARGMDDKPSRSNRPVNPRGTSHIRFGECMTPQEADAALRRRPGSECRHRDMGGNGIFEGPYPAMENCAAGDGSDITGCCPKRPVSSSKFQELLGHDVFAIANASETPPPPPRVPYMPEERAVPPHDLPRNPRKNESHLEMGGSVGVEPSRRPSTCPSPTVSSYDILDNGVGNDLVTRARQVEEMKMRSFRGNHIFDFNDEPRNEAEDEEHFSISKLAKRRDIKGNDIFGGGKRNNFVGLRAPNPCENRLEGDDHEHPDDLQKRCNL